MGNRAAFFFAPVGRFAVLLCQARCKRHSKPMLIEIESDD
jgi:hypothetical protein